jgi:hypothetical protein
LRCISRKPCHGALLVEPHDQKTLVELGRVDLNVPARSDVVLEVTLSRAGLAYVRAHHHVRADVLAFFGTRHPHVDVQTITVLAPRNGPSAAIDRAARRKPRHVRPGCGSACRNLGGLGAGPGTPPPRIRVQAKTARVKGTIAPIPMRCLTRKACTGVLLLSVSVSNSRDRGGGQPPSNPPELSRVDLNIPGRTELVVEVTLSRAGLAYVRAHHRVHVDLTAAYPDQVDVLAITLLA